jgi:hypothetical protein
VEVELAHDVAAMGFDGRVRDVRARGDHRRALAFGNEAEHLQLALVERADVLGHRLALRDVWSVPGVWDVYDRIEIVRGVS